MAQHKTNRVTRSQLKLTTEIKAKVPQENQTKQKKQVKNLGEKRKVGQQQTSLLKMLFKKQQKEVPIEPKIQLQTIKEQLKNVSIYIILEKCPKVNQFYQKISSHPYVNKQLLIHSLDKYFHGPNSANWESKYAPRTSTELFQKDFAKKVQQWVKDFYLYRKNNQDNDSDFSFIDDRGDNSYSKSIQLRMQGYGWNCIGLVLKGRSGMGKFSLLNAIAKSMKFSVFQFSSENDQLLKLKEQIKGSSQSECVNTIINKKKEQENNKIRRENRSIFNFMNNADKEQEHYIESKKPKRIQIFRDFTLYFPNDDKSDKIGSDEAYLKYLLDAVQSSSIPYILTSSKFEYNFKQSITDKINKLDLLDFIEPSVEELTNFYWIILQIESFFTFNQLKQIAAESLFDEINRQLQNCIFDNTSCLKSYEFVRDLVIRANKKIRYISKYLQYVVKNNIQIKAKVGQNDKMKEEGDAKNNNNLSNGINMQEKNGIKKQEEIQQKIKQEDSQEQEQVSQKIDNQAQIKQEEQDSQSQNRQKEESLKQLNQLKQFVIRPTFQKVPFQEDREIANQLLNKAQREILAGICPQRLVYDIDWSIARHVNLQIDVLEQTADGQQSEKSFDELQNLGKYLINKENSGSSRNQVKISQQRNKTLKELRLQLELEILEDNPMRKNHKQFIHEESPELDFDEQTCTSFQKIPYQIHRESKKKLIQSMNKRRIEKRNLPLGVNQKTFYMLPVLLAPKRSNRGLRKSNSEAVQENLCKVFDRQEVEYIKKFCKFVSNS